MVWLYIVDAVPINRRIIRQWRDSELIWLDKCLRLKNMASQKEFKKYVVFRVWWVVGLWGGFFGFGDLGRGGGVEILCIMAIQNCHQSSVHFRSLYIITESIYPGERYNVFLDSKQTLKNSQISSVHWNN